MSKLGDKVLTDKTRIMVTITNFFLLIFTIVGGVVFVVNWTADVEHRLFNIEGKIIILSEDVAQGKKSYINTQTSLAEIQTDLKWIRAYMEKE
jgi:hypothetical protein